MPITLPITDKHGHKLSLNQFIFKIKNRILAIYLDFVTGLLWWCVGNVPLHSVRKLFYRLAGIHIGAGSTIHMKARIYDPRHIRIGHDTLVGERATLDGRKFLPNSQGGLEIGNHVDIASEVMVWTSEHDLSDPYLAPIEEKVIIEDYVFIGPRSIILPGVTVHQGAVVAAGSVVTKDVAQNEIVAGIPAKKIGERPVTDHRYRLGRPRLFQ